MALNSSGINFQFPLYSPSMLRGIIMILWGKACHFTPIKNYWSVRVFNVGRDAKEIGSERPMGG